jgi:hypothetical protein
MLAIIQGVERFRTVTGRSRSRPRVPYVVGLRVSCAQPGRL